MDIIKEKVGFSLIEMMIVMLIMTIIMAATAPIITKRAKKTQGITVLSSPVGTIMAYAGAGAPSGWLRCNGDRVSRTTYSALFGVINTVYGAGDGSTTFNIPDLRGQFIRGLDDRSTGALDPYYAENGNTVRTLGKTQNDSFKSHVHTQSSDGVNPISPYGAGAGFNFASNGVSNNQSVPTLATGENETRPKNMSLNYIIKY